MPRYETSAETATRVRNEAAAAFSLGEHAEFARVEASLAASGMAPDMAAIMARHVIQYRRGDFEPPPVPLPEKKTPAKPAAPYKDQIFTCIDCRSQLPYCAFPRDKRCRIGIRPECKSCHRERRGTAPQRYKNRYRYKRRTT
ncbi:MAG: hypothetical protein AB7G08_23875 [Hyphomicrobiaceae bacterium]